ncbi:unnamed protein product, partial [Iphiclides podalirius]
MSLARLAKTASHATLIGISTIYVNTSEVQPRPYVIGFNGCQLNFIGFLHGSRLYERIGEIEVGRMPAAAFVRVG